jgi:dTDP-4-amino-4,6-dideoxygalactose transaminase
VDWEAIEHCVAGFGALAVEDAAQGHGAEWRGAPLGSLGRLSVLSFGRGKGWTAGRGGALVTRGGLQTPDGARVASAGTGVELAITAAALVQWALGRPGRYRLAAAIPWLHLGETRYRDPEAPRAISRAAACLLERTLPLAAREASIRRANAEALLASLPAGVRVLSVTAPRDGTPGWLRLPLRLSRGMAGFSEARLALRCGVTPGYPTTLAELAPVRERMTRVRGRWPGAEDLARQLVTLPTHSLVSAGERGALVRLLEGYD